MSASAWTLPSRTITVECPLSMPLTVLDLSASQEKTQCTITMTTIANVDGKKGAPPVKARAAIAPIITVRMKSRAVALLRKRFFAKRTIATSRRYIKNARAARCPYPSCSDFNDKPRTSSNASTILALVSLEAGLDILHQPGKAITSHVFVGFAVQIIGGASNNVVG